LTPPGGRGVETERRAGRFVALDSLRGLAAVGVLFSHIGPIGVIGTLLRRGLPALSGSTSIAFVFQSIRMTP
jgi:peptidoglycan/LPS O-acetylase OafA/YrhL